MNGNTYFNFIFYNPLPVRQQTRKPTSLRESLGVRAAYISWIVIVILLPRDPPPLRIVSLPLRRDYFAEYFESDVIKYIPLVKTCDARDARGQNYNQQ